MKICFSRFGVLLAATSLAVAIVSAPAAAAESYTAANSWGTFNRPFAADSPWNSRPVYPVLGTATVKKPLYNPTWIPSISAGSLSLAVFMAKAGDAPVTIYGKTGTTGVADPDSGYYRTINLPRWPASVVPASGSDGHADIVDTVSGVIHSFYQLKYTNGKWTASMYSWSRLDGTGFGNGAHWSQGARASGAPSMAGIIRKHEVDDGMPYYTHALAMTLPQHTLANGISHPSYIAPATSTDNYAGYNTGTIPMGALMMLPANFDTASLSSPKLRKIASTLKQWGAYVVDSNYDTAYAIHVENGANFALMPAGKWDSKVVADLEKIRAGLRQVIGVSGWINANVVNYYKGPVHDTLSMRGTWMLPTGGKAPGSFDTWQQAVVFPYTTTKISQVNYNNEISKVGWAKPVAGKRMRFSSQSTGGATIRLQVRVGGKIMFDSGYLGNGAASVFNWPMAAANAVTVTLLAESGVNTASTTRGVMTFD